MNGFIRYPQNQLGLFGNLFEKLDNNHPLCILSHKLPWSAFQNHFGKSYSRTGRPAKSIRLMISLLLLQRIFNLSDREVVNRWKQDAYWQYFCGENVLQFIDPPCAASELVHFRKRIGITGVEKIFQLILEVMPKSALKKAMKSVIIDSTVQPKNITFPTDEKLLSKIIIKCRKMASQGSIKLRQSYVRVVGKLRATQRYFKHPVLHKQAKKGLRKLRTIAGRLVREVKKSVLAAKQGVLATKKELYMNILGLYEQVIAQKPKDKNKIYSLHNPHVCCISKGKRAVKYEYGSKVELVVSGEENIILGIKNYQGNPHDSKTCTTTLETVKGYVAGIGEIKEVIGDLGYRGANIKEHEGVSLITPATLRKEKPSVSVGKGNPVKEKVKQTNQVEGSPKGTSYSKYRRMKIKIKGRSSIEGVISQLKHHYKMGRNYLQGEIGDIMNALLAIIGFNCKKLISMKG